MNSSTQAPYSSAALFKSLRSQNKGKKKITEAFFTKSVITIIAFSASSRSVPCTTSQACKDLQLSYVGLLCISEMMIEICIKQELAVRSTGWNLPASTNRLRTTKEDHRYRRLPPHISQRLRCFEPFPHLSRGHVSLCS